MTSYVIILDGIPGLVPVLTPGIQGYKSPGSLGQTWDQAKSLKIILIDSNFLLSHCCDKMYRYEWFNLKWHMDPNIGQSSVKERTVTPCTESIPTSRGPHRKRCFGSVVRNPSYVTIHHHRSTYVSIRQYFWHPWHSDTGEREIWFRGGWDDSHTSWHRQSNSLGSGRVSVTILLTKRFEYTWGSMIGWRIYILPYHYSYTTGPLPNPSLPSRMWGSMTCPCF
jgi:hypothetical protein